MPSTAYYIVIVLAAIVCAALLNPLYALIPFVLLTMHDYLRQKHIGYFLGLLLAAWIIDTTSAYFGTALITLVAVYLVLGALRYVFTHQTTSTVIGSYVLGSTAAWFTHRILVAFFTQNWYGTVNYKNIFNAQATVSLGLYASLTIAALLIGFSAKHWSQRLTR